jgi:hypothetical protein
VVTEELRDKGAFLFAESVRRAPLSDSAQFVAEIKVRLARALFQEIAQWRLA